MFKIEYSIKLNERGRPYIELPVSYENNAEDRFFVLEIAKWMLQDLLNRNTGKLDDDTIVKLDIATRFIGQVGDEVAEILWHNMLHLGETMFLFDKRFHVKVKTIEDRDNLPDFIIYEDKIYEKKKKLKVLVTDEEKVYEISDDTDSIVWEEV